MIQHNTFSESGGPDENDDGVDGDCANDDDHDDDGNEDDGE